LKRKEGWIRGGKEIIQGFDKWRELTKVRPSSTNRGEEEGQKREKKKGGILGERGLWARRKRIRFGKKIEPGMDSVPEES